jgi:hypothetical protein
MPYVGGVVGYNRLCAVGSVGLLVCALWVLWDVVCCCVFVGGVWKIVDNVVCKWSCEFVVVWVAGGGSVVCVLVGVGYCSGLCGLVDIVVY